MSSHKCMECIHGSVCDSFEGSHAKNCEFFKPEQEWISVEDRLPEQNGYYLVCGTEAIGNIKFLCAVKHFDRDTFRPLSAPSVHWTHWMPLPNPPEVSP